MTNPVCYHNLASWFYKPVERVQVFELALDQSLIGSDKSNVVDNEKLL
jgi:hypothetical protein